jgi:DNA-binding response OmpR family regulator
VDRILLIAADWHFRALVRAQLLEEGYEVTAFVCPETALVHLLRGGEPPHAIVVDVCELDGAAGPLADLGRVTGYVSLILCGGALDQADLTWQNWPPSSVLRRPFRVRDVIEAVYNVLLSLRLE